MWRRDCSGWGRRKWWRRKDQVGWWDVEEDFGLGGEDLNAKVIRGHVERHVGVVGNADVCAGVDAFLRDGNHHSKAWGREDLVGAAELGLGDTGCVRFAADDVVGKDGFGDAGGDREGRGPEDGSDGKFLNKGHKVPPAGRAVRGNLAVTRVVQNYPIVVGVKNEKGCSVRVGVASNPSLRWFAG